MNDLAPEKIHEEVKAQYGRIADNSRLRIAASCCGDSADSSCCGADDDQAVELFANLYQADTTWLPDEVTGLSLGCGGAAQGL